MLNWSKRIRFLKEVVHVLSRKIFPILAITSCVLIPLQARHLQFAEPEINEVTLSGSEKLAKLFEDFFDDLQKLYPEFSTYYGLKKEYNGLWTDHSEAGYDFRYQILEKRLGTLQSIEREGLSAVEQLNYDLFEKDLRDHLEGYIFQTYYMPIDQLGGIPLEVENILVMMPKNTLDDYENILSRLAAIPVLIDQTIDLLKGGLDKKLTQPQVALRNLPNCLSKMRLSAVDNSVFFQPFQNFPDTIDKQQQQQLVQRAMNSIEQMVYPAYATLHDYLEKVYIPNCRTSVGVSDLSSGLDFYEYCVRKHTTTLLSPLEIHEIGLKEVARIHQEMQKILDQISFSGSIADFFKFLNSAPQFFYQEPDSLIEGYKAITAYIDGQLPLLFGRLPQLPYEVVPVPSFSEETQVGAYYVRGSVAIGRPGRFFVNTYDIGSRPKWQMESLSLHEAVPGHHFQISLAQEIKGLPEFRRYNNYTAYIEGWGLYSESLGKELGLYKAPADQFGRLIEEVWRAVRLVVDTGIHAFGWSREEAIAYMMEKTGMGEREVTTEIDRYIVWPGQALAYKIGELSIKRWRREAQEALGEVFDIRSFHDMLLEQGALPLDICEKQVYEWIENQKVKKTAESF